MLHKFNSSVRHKFEKKRYRVTNGSPYNESLRQRGNTTALSDLLDQIDAEVSQFIADGAYDGDPTSDRLIERFGEAVKIVIPPPKNAVFSPDEAHVPTLRDQRPRRCYVWL